MHDVSEKAERPASGGAGKAPMHDPFDFAGLPVYRSTLRLCRAVMDLETQFPDDDRQLIYAGLKRAILETGALIASAFGRSKGPARTERLEEARSRLMECRHYALVADVRYHLDKGQSLAFEADYAEILAALNGLIGSEPDGVSAAEGGRR